MRQSLENWIKLTDLCERDEEFRLKALKLIKADPIFFFKNFLWTYDPRKETKRILFNPYPFQENFILKLNENYRSKKDLLVEKSRDMGFSWLVLGFIVWKMITEKDFSAGVGSRKMQLVDDIGNMKSLMERIRFMLICLPNFLRQGFDRDDDSKLCLVKFPALGSYVSGEAGDSIGRGDRTSLYLIDEFAHIPRSSLVQAAVSQTSDFKIYGSTPNGKGNEFARLRFKTSIDVFVMDWKDHPQKTQEWYNKQKETLDEATMAQEIDRSYSKSTEGRVYKWFDAEIHAKEIIKLNPNYPVIGTFDWGIGDPTAFLLLQYYGGTVRIIDSFEMKDSDISKIFGQVSRILSKYQKGFGDVSAWYGDPDGRNRNIITGESIAQFVKDRYRVHLRFKIPNVIRNRIVSVRMLGEQGRILVSSDQHHVIECFENYKYPDKHSGENETPIHDWTSHTMSALEYYTVYEHGLDQHENKNKNITFASWR